MVSLMVSSQLWSCDLYSLKNSVTKLSAIICRHYFRHFQFASAIYQQKNCQRLIRHLCILHPQWLRQLFVKGYDLVFYELRLPVLSKLYCLFITHLDGWNGRQHLRCWSPCSDFFMCLSLSVKTNYPITEKPGVQNILTCENQGKQHKLSDNQFKCCFWKKNRRWCKHWWQKHWLEYEF